MTWISGPGDDTGLEHGLYVVAGEADAARFVELCEEFIGPEGPGDEDDAS